MKKIVRIMILLLLILCLSACGTSNTEEDSVIVSETQEEAGASVSANTEETASADVSESESISKTDDSNSADEAADSGIQSDEQEDAEDSSAFDVDLTALSSTMVYAEVYTMMYTPDDYLGKTVRMTGMFAVYEGEERNYYACIIADATACCSQGIEFVLAGDFSYPDDYPELGSIITVSGIFDIYYEGQYMYVQLIDAVLE